ncbi:MAG: hypothetical protein J7M40_17900, partial [Planctomycetes bacterium]|nr:hypothetical protein [Planctomycetota bacterium]
MLPKYLDGWDDEGITFVFGINAMPNLVKIAENLPETAYTELIVGDANNRCNQENLIEQLKNGVQAMRMPVDNLVSNWAYMVMASLAWNLKAWYALLLPTKGRWHKKHKSQKRKVLRMEFKKFRNFFIMLP